MEMLGFTDAVALARGLNGIAAKLSVSATDFYVHRIERISIPAVTNRRASKGRDGVAGHASPAVIDSAALIVTIESYSGSLSYPHC